MFYANQAIEIADTMKFLVSVNGRYMDEMESIPDRLAERCEHYTEKVMVKLGSEKDDVSPYVYMTI